MGDPLLLPQLRPPTPFLSSSFSDQGRRSTADDDRSSRAVAEPAHRRQDFAEPRSLLDDLQPSHEETYFVAEQGEEEQDLIAGDITPEQDDFDGDVSFFQDGSY